MILIVILFFNMYKCHRTKKTKIIFCEKNLRIFLWDSQKKKKKNLIK